MKHLPFAAFALLALAPLAQAENVKICFEAESTNSVVPILNQDLPTSTTPYAGRGYVEMPWTAPKNRLTMSYKLKVTKPGIYYAWARTQWRNGCGNSVSLFVNGRERILGEDGLYDKWHWVGSPTPVYLQPGVNSIALRNREPGVKIDQVFFCSDKEYVPTRQRQITHGNPIPALKAPK